MIDNKFILDTIGYIAIIFFVLGFLSTKTNNMRINGMISTILFGISIAYYNGINGLFVSFISFCTKFISIFIKEEKIQFLKYISFPLAIIFYFIFNTEGLIGILPALSLIFIIFADIQKDIIKMKYIYYGSAISWLLYGIFLNAIPAILFDLFGIITLTYSIYKLKQKKGS